MSGRKEDKRRVKELLDEIEKLPGWRVRRVGGGSNRKHSTVFPPGDHKIIMVPCTSSDYRWLLNLRSELRRAGYEGTTLD